MGNTEIFFKTKDTWILLFLVEHYAIKTDIYYQDMLIAWISLTLSCHLSLTAIILGMFSKQHRVNEYRFFSGWPTLVCPCVGFHVTYDFILTPPAVLSMSCSSYLDGLQYGR